MQTRAEIAAFYLLGLRYRLLERAAIVRWADEVLGVAGPADAWLIEVSLSGLETNEAVDALLRDAAPIYTGEVIAAFGGLLQRRLVNGRIAARDAARYAYEIYAHTDRDVAMDVFGNHVCVIDEVYEGWWLGATPEADRYVRDWLERFESQTLPPID